jgi:hypothetical protein
MLSLAHSADAAVQKRAIASSMPQLDFYAKPELREVDCEPGYF